MPSKITKLTKKQKEAMPGYAQKWIDIGLKTGETDWETFDKYFPICYEKSGLKYPTRIVRVPSPFFGAHVASIAAEIWNKRYKARGASVGASVRASVDASVGASVDASVDASVRASVGASVDASVRASVDASVDASVRASVGDSVRASVRASVRDSVDASVGDSVDASVGASVGDSVGDYEKAIIKTVAKIALEQGIKRSWNYWLGGQFWVGGYWYWGVAFVNFFFDICKLKLSKDIMERAEAYRKVCESVNYIWPNRDFVIVCARPVKINRNAQGRLHSLIEKSIEYPDGWGLYHINGVRFEKALWEKVPTMSAKEVFALENMEQRRVAYEVMDKEKMKELDSKILDEVKDDGYKHPMKIIEFMVSDMDLRYLNCFCPSTGREYFLETREKTCWSAKLGSFGLTEKFDNEY